MVTSGPIVMAMVNDNDVVVGLVDVDPNIDDKEELRQNGETFASTPEEAKEGGEAFTLTSHHSASSSSFDVDLHSALTPKEKDETSEASISLITRRKEKEETREGAGEAE
ncbi:hypothetical protein B296_00033000 [Ensete ventricosum]|uniref:Uncharacterized protein n=1 Tax=Ensete ventricosum TaxID=4639 RepID=A0A426YZS8_ENSVE|nr:hypothetical protein B296_00033000 [Ensete ventricosum]